MSMAPERKQALIRAGAAVGLAMLLFVGLLVAEDGKPLVPPKAVEKPAAAAASAPAAGSEGPAAAAQPPAIDVETPAVAAVVAGAPAAAPGGALPELAPAHTPPAPSPVVAPAPAPVPAAAVARAPAKPAAALPDGFQVQLGVFGDAANADALRQELARRGLPARVETRVVLGPYKDRHAAEAAQAAVRRDGHGPGVIVPPKGGGNSGRPAK
ncbi:hypothetical protein GRF61_11490 [Azoarcus sp. TTM-91]|uniref:SPOR domain-containing protein n=1 Tax=Azoarcus sp. TTM-91 TaxID=2691581 RepID=UPI00145F19B6|nr:SPOR domain-containing protein [Azoarcus sp. TTM-91]NMG35065.1 hypothetical protein [Azoarcus sp. TTM-91]